MPLALWSPQYATGNDLIDGQHHELFRIINELHAFRKRGRGQDQVRNTLASLVSYTMHHFRCEEKLMVDHGYPDCVAHKKIHDELTRKVQQLAADDKSPPNVLSASIAEFLNQWLCSHNEDVDRKMIEYITAQQKKQGGAGVPAAVSRSPRP